MFKNILVATDGSDLAAKAVERGILFGNEIGAKITAVTVTEPFLPEHTPIEYKKHAEAYAEKVLGTVAAAAISRCRMRDASYRTRTGLSGNHRCRLGERLRFDCNGLARASRRFGCCPRQPDGQSADALQDPCTSISLSVLLGVCSSCGGV